MYLGTLETRSFTFQVFANSADLALRAMRGAWEKHCTQVDAADFSYFEDSQTYIEIPAVMAAGSCGCMFSPAEAFVYRDYELFFIYSDIDHNEGINLSADCWSDYRRVKGGEA